MQLHFQLLRVVQQPICEASLHVVQINLKITRHSLDFWVIVSVSISFGFRSVQCIFCFGL